MNCPQCEHENPTAAKFCLECGVKLQKVCRQCGVELPPTAKFCLECGAAVTPAATAAAAAKPTTLEEQFTRFQQGLPQSFREQLVTPVEGENRIVTVLFADMSSSVRTTGDLHPEDAAALVNGLLKAMVDVLLKYEGRIDRFLGDGVLAVFGVPQAHESDAERAILAALQIRDAAQELGLQITAGINTGEVYVGGVGSERYHELTVMGPVVNLASRLQESAEPGQILAGEATYRHTRRAFEFAPLSLAIKGIDRPVAAYVVERALPHPEKVRGIEGLRAELIGRDEEFAKLREAFEELLRGRGQMVSLIGEAGVGKSRLVSELKQVVFTAEPAENAEKGREEEAVNTKTRGVLWLEGRCLELGMTASYWLFVDLFRQYFAWRPEDDDRARGERIAACLQEFVAHDDLTAERCDEIGPLLGNLLSVRFGNEWDERLKNASPEQIRHQTFLAVHDFLVAVAKQQPLVLLLEDLHWADSLSLDLVSLLMEALRLAPILLLCVYRPEREHKCWHLATIATRKCPDRFTEIHLRELTPQQSRRLVESLLAIDNLPASVKELILEKSRGNPFFVEEVIRSLIDAGMVYQESEVWRAREGIETLAVPESVQSVILSRVDRLERDLRGVLESASVIGRLFRRRLLEYTTQEATELERALWELEDRQLIYQERVVPEEEYSFQHVLTQETIYQNILRRRRAGFHQKVAEAMETLYRDGLDEFYEQLAHHYDRSASDEKAVEYLLKAGEKARRAYHNDEAIGYFGRALERLQASGLGETHGAWRLAALNGLGQIYLGVGKAAEAEEHFRRAIAVGREIGLAPRELARLYFWLGEVLFWESRYDEMIRSGHEGLMLLRAAPESVETVLMNQMIAISYWMKGDREKYWEFAGRNVPLLQGLPYSEELRPAYSHMVMAYAADKKIEEARRWSEALEEQAQQHHDVRAAAGASHSRAWFILLPSGDLRGSIAEFGKALELFEKIGDTKHQGYCVGPMARAFLGLGDLPQAEEYALRGLHAAEATGQTSYIAANCALIGTVALCRGCWDPAAEAFGRAAQICGEIGTRGSELAARVSLGRAYLAQGERGAALKAFQEALALARMVPSGLAAVLSGLEEAYGDAGELQTLRARFREERPEVGGAPFQGFLEPARVTAIREPPLLRDDFAASLSPEWVWHDPFGDCSMTLRSPGARTRGAPGRGGPAARSGRAPGGLEIQAANGRDLWHINLSAPRLLHAAAGDFAVQTVCLPVSEEKPVIGGLLLWKDEENYLRLDRGTRGPYEISFQGCLANSDVVIGRGRQAAARVFLRLERRGGQVRALCGADGTTWYTAGSVAFSVEDAVEVGPHAIGNIDRTIYHSAHPEGTAIRFESFELWNSP